MYMANLWTSAEHALNYLAQADNIPHRTEGEAVLLEEVPKTVKRILDLGTGDGRLLALLKIERHNVESVAVDFSPTMLEAAKSRFQDDSTVEVIEHNLDESLPEYGTFDAIVSSFAIHHLSHNRKRSLYVEIFNLLQPGGVFCNLEHVASPTVRLHEKFLKAIGVTPAQDDPSNQLLDVETQLKWLRNIGFEDVDCYWKWLELALLIGRKPKL
ncbi:MAG: class I SAM-dependent methyltransferase [Rivularia sp. (in: Bacteria)]|nr:class I SAM-dependent methyltransferase [Rivularia sp. MS3]